MAKVPEQHHGGHEQRHERQEERHEHREERQEERREERRDPHPPAAAPAPEAAAQNPVTAYSAGGVFPTFGCVVKGGKLQVAPNGWTMRAPSTGVYEFAPRSGAKVPDAAIAVATLLGPPSATAAKGVMLLTSSDGAKLTVAAVDKGGDPVDADFTLLVVLPQ